MDIWILELGTEAQVSDQVITILIILLEFGSYLFLYYTSNCLVIQIYFYKPYRELRYLPSTPKLFFSIFIVELNV